MSTDYNHNHGNPNFPSAGARVCWRDDSGAYHWSQLYNVSPEALAWDDAPEGSQAVGSRHGVFSYVSVRVTGRKTVQVPGSGGYAGAYGTKAKITFQAGTADESTADAWIVEGVA